MILKAQIDPHMAWKDIPVFDQMLGARVKSPATSPTGQQQGLSVQIIDRTRPLFWQEMEF